MQQELFNAYIKKFGIETLKKIVKSYVAEDNVEDFIDVINMKKDELIERIFEKTNGENTKIAPLLISNFSYYHQHIFLYRTEDDIDLSKITQKANKLKFPGFKGNEAKFAHADVQDEDVKILLYLPFKISFHIPQDGREERQHVIIHSPTLIRIFPAGVIISIMTFRNEDWSDFLPKGFIDIRSYYRDDKALEVIHEFIEKNIYENRLFSMRFSGKSKALLKMKEIDLYLGTKIAICESRYSTIRDMTRKRETLKEAVPAKVAEILKSKIIKELDIILKESVFGLPESTRMLLYPEIGSIRITKHIKAGDLYAIQNYLFS